MTNAEKTFTLPHRSTNWKPLLFCLHNYIFSIFIDASWFIIQSVRVAGMLCFNTTHTTRVFTSVVTVPRTITHQKTRFSDPSLQFCCLWHLWIPYSVQLQNTCVWNSSFLTDSFNCLLWKASGRQCHSKLLSLIQQPYIHGSVWLSSFSRQNSAFFLDRGKHSLPHLSQKKHHYNPIPAVLSSVLHWYCQLSLIKGVCDLGGLHI